jgi:hypothetical protein
MMSASRRDLLLCKNVFLVSLAENKTEQGGHTAQIIRDRVASACSEISVLNALNQVLVVVSRSNHPG